MRHLLDVTVEKGVFTPDQIIKLLEGTDSDWRGFILAGYYTGARLGDLARLTWQSVDLAERSITFTQKKTGAKIKVPIHSELLDYLLSRSVPDEGRKPVFPTLYNKPGPGKSGLSMTFKRLMARAGIVDGIARQKAGDAGRNVSLLSFHSLRHSFTSALANAGCLPMSAKSSPATPTRSPTKSTAITSFPRLQMPLSELHGFQKEIHNEQPAFRLGGSCTNCG
jgi:integrase